MSEEHLQQTLVLGSGILLGQPFGGQLQGGEIDQGLGLEWELCRSQTQGPRSRCTRSFSITGDPWP